MFLFTLSGFRMMWRSRVPWVRRLLATPLMLAMAFSMVLAADSARTGFGASLATDKPVYASGEPIRIVFEVSNRTETPVRLDFASAQRFYMAITAESGAEVWR